MTDKSSTISEQLVEQAAKAICEGRSDDWSIPDDRINAEIDARVALESAGLAALLDVAEAAQRFMDAADLRISEGMAYFDAWHDARHDLYQALAVIPQKSEEP